LQGEQKFIKRTYFFGVFFMTFENIWAPWVNIFKE
jgi:hypothetical protein